MRNEGKNGIATRLNITRKRMLSKGLHVVREYPRQIIFLIFNLKQCVMAVKSFTPWQPVPYTVLKSEQLDLQLSREGYAIIDNFISDKQIAELKSLYEQFHSFKGAGMFWGLYSQDLDYRLKTHEGIGIVVSSSLERIFTQYKVVINSFVIKAPGEGSEFVIHQDTTATDELKYSPLSVWYALEDVTNADGALCFVPKSHRWFSPYRGISFPFPFSNITDVVSRYLVPVCLKKGQAVIFDPRIVHHSLENASGRDRVAIVSGIFPMEAHFEICYKDTSVSAGPIEIYKENEGFLLTYRNFYQNCMARPSKGIQSGIADKKYVLDSISAGQWVEVCAEYGVEALNLVVAKPVTDMKLISEPI